MVKNLRSFRLSKGLSQQQLATAIGSTQQSINKYENHATEPDIQTLIRLADCFHISIDELVGHSPQPDVDPGKALILSKEEILLIQNRRKLSRSERDSIRFILENYVKNKA